MAGCFKHSEDVSASFREEKGTDLWNSIDLCGNGAEVQRPGPVRRWLEKSFPQPGSRGQKWRSPGAARGGDGSQG